MENSINLSAIAAISKTVIPAAGKEMLLKNRNPVDSLQRISFLLEKKCKLI